MPAAEPVPYWWFHGDVEVGGRFFLNDPQRNGIGPILGGRTAWPSITNTATSGRARSRISGYPPEPTTASIRSTSAARTSATTIRATGSTRRRPASTTSTSTGTRRRISTAPARRLSINGVGTTTLTLPPGLSAPRPPPRFLKHQSVSPYDRSSASSATPHRRRIVGLRRCLGHQGRLLPYASHRHAGRRRGRLWQYPLASATDATQVPRPVDDVTQNYGLNGEYVGTLALG